MDLQASLGFVMPFTVVRIQDLRRKAFSQAAVGAAFKPPTPKPRPLQLFGVLEIRHTVVWIA
jgi:hypothetical protein